MKLTSVSVVIILKISMMAAVDFSFNVVPRVCGVTIYVDDDGGADYSTIQEAVDAAIDGDLVFVYQGTYYENVIVNKRIHLMGESKDNTIIDGGGNDNTITITVDFVDVSGFTVTNCGGGGEDAGIMLSYVSDCRIFNNNASGNNREGISLSYSHMNNISYNDASSNLNGICLSYSHCNNISGNKLLSISKR